MPYVSKVDRTAVWPDDMPLPEGTAKGERRLQIETRGPWGVVSKITGLAVAKDPDGVRVYGDRSLLKPRESGYQMEGRVSVDGKSYRAITSSQLFVHQGKLVDIGILYVVKR